MEFELRGGKYRVRSAYTLTPGQFDVKWKQATRRWGGTPRVLARTESVSSSRPLTASLDTDQPDSRTDTIATGGGPVKGPQAPDPVTSDPTQEFANEVLAAARASTTGWFGDNKVFISHLFQTLHASGSPYALDRKQFNQRLIEANRAGTLRLSRADLVEAMDPADVAASEFTYFGERFHFVRTDYPSAPRFSVAPAATLPGILDNGNVPRVREWFAPKLDAARVKLQDRFLW